MTNIATASSRAVQVQESPGSGGDQAPSQDERAAALLFVRNLATEVSGGKVNLPCFPDVVIRIRKALDDPETKLSQTVKIVSTEPRLAARLVQAANSAAFNPSGRPLTDLRTAITRLGQRPVQSAVMAFAVQQLRLAPALRSIAKPLNVLWEESITVASICQVIAKRTKISPEEAFLTGLLHGIGRLYVMVRAAGKLKDMSRNREFMDMVESWHPAIGKAVLENWGFAEAMCEALGEQCDYDRSGKGEADLADILIVGVVLSAVLRQPGPRTVAMDGINSFHRLGLSSQDCTSILRHAEHQLGVAARRLGLLTHTPVLHPTKAGRVPAQSTASMGSERAATAPRLASPGAGHPSIPL